MTKFNSRPPPTMAPQQNANNQANSTFVEKLMIGLDHAPPTFNLREQIIGAGGANLNYIRNETGAVATLRGRGSMFIDPVLGVESPELLHLYIEHPRYEGLQAAKQLAKNLIETLQQELAHFQQLSQNTPNVTFSNGGAIISQGQPVSQINVPPPMLAVPPPIIQQNAIDSQGNQTAIVQQNFVQQNPPPTLGGPPQTVQSQPQAVIHQQIIPQTVPIQLQQGNMVIQQPIQQPPNIGNVNIPPPGIPIPIKTGQIVQFQQPPPSVGPPQLTQPPPNVQLQHAQPATATQIVLNPTQNYQYQYIQQPVQTGDAQIQPNQVTIQHIYHPQQQIQGIVQSTTPQSQAQTFDQFQHVRSQQFQSAPSQQYITVQGSTAYMVPPPAIIHQQPPSQSAQTQSVQTQITTSNPNIIFQPPPQLQQVQMQMQPAIAVNIPPPVQPPVVAQQEQSSASNGTDENRNTPVKEESKSGSDNEESPRKTPDEKPDNDVQSGDSNGDTQQPITTSASVSVSIPPPPIQQQNIALRPPPPTQMATSITLPAAQVPPPIMAVPPPMTCVQHFMGNTLITTHPPAQTHTNQIYNQVPVSIQQIQSTGGQQIHVSTPSGQHFLVNATPQWQGGPPPTAQLTQQHQMQQISSNGTIQNVQITHQQIGTASATDFRAIPPPATAIAAAQPPPQPTQQPPIMTFNPHVQVQFQPQMLQQMPPPNAIESAQIISSQVAQPPPQFNVVQSQPPNLQLPPGAYQQQQAPQQNTIMASFQQQMKQFSEQMHRPGNKRKLDEDDIGPPNHQPRMGMGPRDQQQNQHQQTLMPPTSQNHQPPISISSTTSNGPSVTNSVGGTTGGSSNKDESNNGQKSQADRLQGQLQQQQLSITQPPPPPPPTTQQQQQNQQFYSDSRSIYQRNEGNESYMDGISRPSFDGPPGGGSGGVGNMMPGPLPPHGPRGPRFHGMMGPGPGFPMRPPHHLQDNNIANFAPHRMNLVPPPPPPPFRIDCPPNMGGYGPPPPRFRGQW